MKILFIDIAIDGHHLDYLKSLQEYNIENYSSVVVLPKKVKELSNPQYIFPQKCLLKKASGYLRFLMFISKIMKIEKPDVIHFLYGDFFYRYFGIGLFLFNEAKTIMTFHHVRRSKLHDISLKIIFSNISTGIVHTRKLVNDLSNIGIRNCMHIEYPNFNPIREKDKREISVRMNLPLNKPILLALGGTRNDKGLDILLESLEKVKCEFHLLISGKEEKFKEDYIREKIKTYKDKVTLQLKYLSIEEYNDSLLVSDIIVLPYKRIFDGASGPLTDAVWLRKMIIGPSHGSLGELIQTQELGKTFESESFNDLARVIEESLINLDSWEFKADSYRKSLRLENFTKSYFDLFLD